jgi:hypothetical protein
MVYFWPLSQQETNAAHFSVNVTFTSQLDIIPDFDMFQSHPYVSPKGIEWNEHDHLQVTYFLSFAVKPSFNVAFASIHRFRIMLRCDPSGRDL